MLEPTVQLGYRYLKAVRNAVSTFSGEVTSLDVLQAIHQKGS